MSTPEHFDAVVIGSGFGGSVMTYRLAKAGLRVCLLERGKRYPPGSFARSPLEMRSNFWDPSSGRFGLFQIWDFDGIDGVVSAGLGGGSLIYANVLIRKPESWFYRRTPDGKHQPWPVTRADLDPHYDRVHEILVPQRFPFHTDPYDKTPKTRAFTEAAIAAGLEWEFPELAVTFGSPEADPVPGEPIFGPDRTTTDNLHGRTRYTCRLCGECDLGCNYGSKNTLDYNYLTLADREKGATIRDLCEVVSFAPIGDHKFSVSYFDHSASAKSESPAKRTTPIEVTADNLVVSAGTFGSTFLMLKNCQSFGGLGDNLGRNFSGNGDFLGLIHDAKVTEGDDVRTRVLAPSRGSVITATVRVPDETDGGTGPGYYIQDGGYPGFVDWLAETTNVGSEIHRAVGFIERRIVSKFSQDPQTDIDSDMERLIGNAHRSASLLPLLGMGLDTPSGRMTIDDERQHLHVDWSERDSRTYFDRVIETMGDLASHMDAELTPDPLYYLHKKMITVHPVGGCSMGHSADDGVVDSYGQVFGFPGFYVADGSVMPGPVGPNPSFTIAALADRVADHLLGP